VWLQEAKPYKGEEFYEDLLVYTDDLLTVVINLQAILDDVDMLPSQASDCWSPKHLPWLKGEQGQASY
jgi:hypothetical protein